MKFRVTSKRGDHQAVLEAPDVAEALFNKLSGKTSAALPAEMKTKIPDTFGELEGLWREGQMGYTAISQDKNENLIGLKDFVPEAETVVFIAPIAAG